MPTPPHKNSFPEGNKIYNFGRPFLDHNCYKLSFSDPCPRVEIYKAKMHVHFITKYSNGLSLAKKQES